MNINVNTYIISGKMAVRVGARENQSPRNRKKTEVYKTEIGLVIVEDEFLNFLVTNKRYANNEDISAVAVSHLTSEEKENSKKVLYEQCRPGTRQKVNISTNKDKNNIKECLSVLNEMGENIPLFVSYYIDDLLPISFENLDVSCLLGRNRQINEEDHGLRESISLAIASRITCRFAHAATSSVRSILPV